MDVIKFVRNSLLFFFFNSLESHILLKKSPAFMKFRRFGYIHRTSPNPVLSCFDTITFCLFQVYLHHIGPVVYCIYAFGGLWCKYRWKLAQKLNVTFQKASILSDTAARTSNIPMFICFVTTYARKTAVVHFHFYILLRAQWLESNCWMWCSREKLCSAEEVFCSLRSLYWSRWGQCLA